MARLTFIRARNLGFERGQIFQKSVQKERKGEII